MKWDPDKLLNQLVVAALTVFIVVILLLAALVLRQVWLQQRIADVHTDVQANLDDLEEITEGIQQELTEIQTTPSTVQNLNNWEGISEALGDVNQQLDLIEQDLGEVALALEPQADATSALAGDEEQLGELQNQIDQVFTIFAILVAIAGIAIAILLGIAVKAQQNASYTSKSLFLWREDQE